MSSFLSEELGVAMSGVKWDIGNFKLWQSTRADIILFTPKQPVLAKSANGKYQVAVSVFRQQEGDTYKITGGSAIFTIASAVQFDARAFEELKKQWTSEMNAIGPRPPLNPRFIPLNVQKGEATVLVNPQSGTPNVAHNNKDIGTPGGTNSFLIELTALGAQEWAQGIREKKGVPADVKMMYEYLRMMPDVGAEVHVNGQRVFDHISGEMKASYNGFWYGGSAEIEAAWENLTREGAIEIVFIGTLPPELEEIRRDLTSTFATQAREQLFNSLFQPLPQVDPAQAGDSGGIFGGANFAFKWKHQREATNLDLTLRFKGWTWLKASMDAGITGLLHELDDSYVTEVNTEMSFPASVLIDSDPMLENVAVSWTPSEGLWPQTPFFGPEGGNQTYTITSARPNDVRIRYSAQVNYAPAAWPIIPINGEGTVAQGLNTVVVKPSALIGRNMIFMYVRGDDNQIKFTDIENDHLIVNVTYSGRHLSNPIRASARITPFEPLEFSYPLGPDGRPGEAKFSAFGVIGNRPVVSAEQPISVGEALMVLANPTGIQVVSSFSAETERDPLIRELQRAQARPIIEMADGRVLEETTRAGDRGDAITGTVVAVEYGYRGPALVIETPDGKQRVIHLRSVKEADPFDDMRKQVQVYLDEAGEYADRIRVQVT